MPRPRSASPRASCPASNSGQVEISVSRDSFGVTGTLNLGGVMAGSVVTVGYTSGNRPVARGQGHSPAGREASRRGDAKVTIKRAARPGQRRMGGLGRRQGDALAPAAPSGTLDILFDGSP